VCGDALEYVREQTPEICLAAVKDTCDSLVFVREQTPEICLTAVKGNPYTLCIVKQQTPEICAAALVEHQVMMDLVNISLEISLRSFLKTCQGS
jgi:ribosomal protein S30